MALQNKAYNPPPFMDERSEKLFAYCDKRLPVTGFFEKLTYAGKERRKVALLNECHVRTPAGDVSLGHFWIQNADAFADLEVARPVAFTAIVTLRIVYSEKLGQKVRRCNLNVPIDIQYADRNATCLAIPTTLPLVAKPYAKLPVPIPDLPPGDDIPPLPEDEEEEMPEETTQPVLEPVRTTISPLQAIRRVRELAELLGGLDVLVEIVEELRRG